MPKPLQLQGRSHAYADGGATVVVMPVAPAYLVIIWPISTYR